MNDSYYKRGTLHSWSEKRDTLIPAPLCVRSRWYRKIIAEILRRHLDLCSENILSIGSGTGVMEAELLQNGFLVTASDIHPDAISLCNEKKISTIEFNIMKDDQVDALFSAVYADGVLGHLGDLHESESVWKNVAKICNRLLIVSNDLADSDISPSYGVFSDPNAYFYRPISGAVSRAATRSGHWEEKWRRIIKYRRPNRGVRRREICIFSKITGAQMGDKAEYL